MRTLSKSKRKIYRKIRKRLIMENCDKLVVIGKDEDGNEIVFDGRPRPTFSELREAGSGRIQ